MQPILETTVLPRGKKTQILKMKRMIKEADNVFVYVIACNDYSDGVYLKAYKNDILNMLNKNPLLFGIEKFDLHKNGSLYIN